MSQGGSCKRQAGRGQHAGPPAAPAALALTWLFAVFALQRELPRAFQRIRLLIQSNWGKSRYTCIYRVQVHGKVKETNSIGQA